MEGLDGWFKRDSNFLVDPRFCSRPSSSLMCPCCFYNNYTIMESCPFFTVFAIPLTFSSFSVDITQYCWLKSWNLYLSAQSTVFQLSIAQCLWSAFIFCLFLGTFYKYQSQQLTPKHDHTVRTLLVLPRLSQRSSIITKCFIADSFLFTEFSKFHMEWRSPHIYT